MDELLSKVKANLILEHTADDALLKSYITAAVSYAESYQHIPEATTRRSPCRPPQSKPSSCCHPTSMKAGTAARAASLRITPERHSRCGTRSICCSAWIGGGRYEFWKNERLCDIVETRQVKDSEGFTHSEDEVLASVRVYQEGRHGSQRWANLAAFSEATDLFRFRCIPGLTVTTDQFLICDDCRYDIVSVENVKGRGMYIEVLAKKEVPTIG